MHKTDLDGFVRSLLQHCVLPVKTRTSHTRTRIKIWRFVLTTRASIVSFLFPHTDSNTSRRDNNVKTKKGIDRQWKRREQSMATVSCPSNDATRKDPEKCELPLMTAVPRCRGPPSRRLSQATREGDDEEQEESEEWYTIMELC